MDDDGGVGSRDVKAENFATRRDFRDMNVGGELNGKRSSFMSGRSLTINALVNTNLNVGNNQLATVREKDKIVSMDDDARVGLDEVENPIKYFDGLKRPRVQYSTSRVSNAMDSTEVHGVLSSAPNSNLSISLIKKAN